MGTYHAPSFVISGTLAGSMKLIFPSQQYTTTNFVFAGSVVDFHIFPGVLRQVFQCFFEFLVDLIGTGPLLSHRQE